MAIPYSSTYRITARQAQREAGRFEYVVSRPNREAVRSTATYPTHAAAKAAGTQHARDLARGVTPAPTIE